MRSIYLSFYFLLISVLVYGQATDDFRSVASGDWNNLNNWARFNGTTWINPAPNFPTSADGVITILNSHTITVTAPVTISETIIDLGGAVVVSSGVTLTITNTNNQDAPDVTVLGDLTVEGTLLTTNTPNILYNGTSLSCNGAINFTNGTTTFGGLSTLISGSGIKDFWNVTINNGTAVTYNSNINFNGLDLIVDGSLTTDVNTSPAVITLASIDLAGTGTLDFTNVTIGTGTTTPDANYTIRGDLVVSGSLAAGTGTGTFAGNTSITQGVIVFNNIDVSGTLTLSAGAIRINGNINNTGTINPGTGTILFGGTTVITNTGTINFNNVDFSSGGASMTAPSTLMGIAGDFTSDGTFNNGGGTIVFNGSGTQTLTAPETYNHVSVIQGATIASTSSQIINGTFNNNGTVNFTNGMLTLGGASVTTLANPSSTTIDNLTLLSTTGASLTANSALTITGTFTLNTGANITATPTSTVTKGVGDFVCNGNYLSAGTTIFSGASTISGAGQLTFNDLIVNAQTTPEISYTINGDISGSGTLTAGTTGVATFAGNSNISGTGAKNFFNVTINDNVDVIYSSDVSIVGNTLNFVGPTLGSLKSELPTSPAIITFTTLNITDATNVAVLDFSNVTIGTGASTTLSVDYTIRGNLVVTGTLLQTTGTVTFAGITAKSGTGACTFNNVVVEPGATFSSVTSHTINGTFLNDGTVNFTGGTLTLGAASTTNLTNPLASTTFNGLITLAGSTITDVATSTLTINGIFDGRANYTPSGTTIFNGATTMSGAGAKTFTHLVVPGTLTPATNASYTVTGNITVNGTLDDNTGSTVTFNGTTLISGTGTTIDFYNVIINPGATVTYSSSLRITGVTFVGHGNLQTDSPTSPANITFLSVIISGAGIKDFTNVTIGPGATTPNAAYTIRGNLNVIGTLDAGTATTTFAGTTTITQGTITFNNIIISGASNSLTLSSGTIRVNGNIDNSGIINPGTGTLLFGGTTVITNSGTLNLNNIDFTLTTNSMTAPVTTLGIAGNFTSTGTFNNGGGTILFNGTTALSASEIYNNVEITGIVTSANVSQTVAGNMVNNGSFTLGTGTLTWSGTGTMSGTGSVSVEDLNVTGTFVYTSSGNLTLLDDIIGTGAFDASGSNGTVIFVGAASAISGSTPKIFNKLEVNSPGVMTPAAGMSYTVYGDISGTGVLNAGNGTTTFVGTSTISGVGAKNFNHINITGTVTAATALNVLGDFTNNGTFNATAQTVTYSGSNNQTVSGNAMTLGNMVVNKTATTLINNSNIELMGVLTMANGTFDADGAGSGIFILNSDATGDAAIGVMAAGSSITGQVTFERHFINATSRWRNLAFPVTDVTYTELGSSITLTPGSLATYTESVPGDVNQGWNIISAGTLNSTKGHTAWMYNIQPITISVRGPLLKNVPALTGSLYDFGVTYTDDPTQPASEDGWNFIPNPFASPIDWNNVGWVKTNVNPVIVVWDENAGVYHYTGIDWDGVIAQGQSFWAQTSGSSPVLTCSESVKVVNSDPIFYRKAGEMTSSKLLISLESGILVDKAVVQFRKEATLAFDREYDAYKLQNAIYNLSTLTSEGVSLAANNLPKTLCTSSIKLNITNIKPGTYTLHFEGLETFTNLNSVSLIDNLQEESRVIAMGEGYTFEVTSDGKSYGADRFQLVFDFDDQEPIPAIEKKGTQLISNYVTGNQWYFNNELLVGATSNRFAPPLRGKYHVVVNNGHCNLNSDFIVVDEGLARVFPNPASTVLKVDVQNLLSGADNGEFLLHTTQGQLMRREIFRSQDAVLEIQVSDLKPGVYILTITTGNGNVLEKTKVIIN